MIKNRKNNCSTKLTKKSLRGVQSLKQFNSSQTIKDSKISKYTSKTNINQDVARDRTAHFLNHFASPTQLMYSSFDKHCYLPPHLSSIQVKETIFKGEPKSAKIRPSSAKKYDYDTLYTTNESKYLSPKVSRQWSGVKSKIKYLLDEDRLTYNHFHSIRQNTVPNQRQYHPDDDLSEQSSVQPQKQ